MPRHRTQHSGRTSLGLVAIGLAVWALFLTVDHFRSQPPAPATSGQEADQPFERNAVLPSTSPSARPSTTPSADAKRRVATRSSREPGAGAPHRIEIDALDIDVPV